MSYEPDKQGHSYDRRTNDDRRYRDEIYSRRIPAGKRKPTRIRLFLMLLG